MTAAEPVVFWCGFDDSAKKSKTGQSVQTLGFNVENKLLKKALVAEHGRDFYKHKRVLTRKAKDVIKKTLESGQHHKREGELRPPFMAPSTDPQQYSMWCSLCNDFGEVLVLCAGCRVGVCSATLDSNVACLAWAPVVDNEDFIYYCPYCVLRLKIGGDVCVLTASHLLDLTLLQQLRLQRDLPRKCEVWYRYDPPVLLIGATWHKTEEPFISFLHQRLCMGYRDSADLVLRMDISLLGNLSDTTVVNRTKAEKVGDGEPVNVVDRFLKRYATAKIIIVIDTHAVEGGWLTYGGNTPSDYKACCLEDILAGCIPPSVFQFISDAVDSPVHNHRSLIVNLACGASVKLDGPRHSLLQGHCSEAVVSFASDTNIVGDVASTLADFCARWTQSAATDYDTLIATTVNFERNRKLVLSRKEHGHVLYTEFDPSQPSGKFVACHYGCKSLIKSKPRAENVRFTCMGCGSKCSVPHVRLDRTTTLGRKGLIKTAFPQEQHRVVWVTNPGSGGEHLAKPTNGKGQKPGTDGSGKPSNRTEAKPPITSSNAASVKSTSGPTTRSASQSAPAPSTASSSSSVKIRIPPASKLLSTPDSKPSKARKRVDHSDVQSTATEKAKRPRLK